MNYNRDTSSEEEVLHEPQADNNNRDPQTNDDDFDFTTVTLNDQQLYKQAEFEFANVSNPQSNHLEEDKDMSSETNHGQITIGNDNENQVVTNS